MADPLLLETVGFETSWQSLEVAKRIYDAIARRYAATGSTLYLAEPISTTTVRSFIASAQSAVSMDDTWGDYNVDLTALTDEAAVAATIPLAFADLATLAGLTEYGYFRRIGLGDPPPTTMAYNDPAFSYGSIDPGDMAGPWLFEDIQALLRVMKRVCGGFTSVCVGETKWKTIGAAPGGPCQDLETLEEVVGCLNTQTIVGWDTNTSYTAFDPLINWQYCKKEATYVYPSIYVRHYYLTTQVQAEAWENTYDKTIYFFKNTTVDSYSCDNVSPTSISLEVVSVDVAAGSMTEVPHPSLPMNYYVKLISTEESAEDSGAIAANANLVHCGPTPYSPSEAGYNKEVELVGNPYGLTWIDYTFPDIP